MRKAILAALIAAIVPVCVFAAGTKSPEEAGVRAAIDHYFLGHSTGVGDHHRKAFHPDAKLFFIREGKFTSWTSEEYAGRASGKPAPDEAQRKRTIEMIDITGDAAIAKIRLEYPGVTFTDYMSLLKVDGEWKIVNKTFHADRKAK
jgi:hypothetical protein